MGLADPNLKNLFPIGRVLKFKNTTRQQGEHRLGSYKCYFDCPPGVDILMYDQTENEIMLGCVIGALYEAVPHSSSPRIKDHGAFIKELFKRRRAAIKDSGLYQYMVDSGMEQRAIHKIYHATQFVATLPLFPMIGHPEAHSWCGVLNLTEEQFQTLAWRGGFGGDTPWWATLKSGARGFVSFEIPTAHPLTRHSPPLVQ